MSKSLQLGQPVEVNNILASCGALLPVIKVWSSGYVLQGIIDGMAVVKQVKEGLFKDCLINYSLEDVRSA